MNDILTENVKYGIGIRLAFLSHWSHIPHIWSIEMHSSHRHSLRPLIWVSQKLHLLLSWSYVTIQRRGYWIFAQRNQGLASYRKRVSVVVVLDVKQHDRAPGCPPVIVNLTLQGLGGREGDTQEVTNNSSCYKCTQRKLKITNVHTLQFGTTPVVGKDAKIWHICRRIHTSVMRSNPFPHLETWVPGNVKNVQGLYANKITQVQKTVADIVRTACCSQQTGSHVFRRVSGAHTTACS